MSLNNDQIVLVLMAERNKLIAYVWSIVGDFSTSEDVVQDVAILAMAKGGDVADEPRFRVWLRRAARLKALEAIRAKKRTPVSLSEEVLEKLESHWAPYDEQSNFSESAIAEILRACFRKLTDIQRRLLGFRYVKGLSSSGIAERLDMKVETVYRSLTRAHRNLADCMKEQIAAKKQAERHE